MLFSASLCYFLASNGEVAQIYRWTDETGRVHFTNNPDSIPPDRRPDSRQLPLTCQLHHLPPALSRQCHRPLPPSLPALRVLPLRACRPSNKKPRLSSNKLPRRSKNVNTCSTSLERCGLYV